MEDPHKQIEALRREVAELRQRLARAEPSAVARAGDARDASPLLEFFEHAASEGDAADAQRRALAALRLQAKTLRLILDGVRDHAISLLDTAGRVQAINAPAERIKGYAPAEVLGEHFRVFFTDEDRAAGLPERELEVARAEGSYQGEGWRRRKDGSRFYAAVTLYALRDDAGALVGFVKVTQDATARQRLAEEREQLLARERQARADAEAIAAQLQRQARVTDTITGNATLALFMMDDRQRCTFMNRAAEAMTGYTLAEVLALERPLHDVIHHTRPDGSPYPLEECPIDRALPRNALTQGRDVFVRRDGTFYSVAFTASPIVEDGRPVGTVIEVRDTTEEDRARALQAAAEARFRRIFESNMIGFVFTSADGRVLDANDYVLRMLGFTRDDLAAGALRWDALTPPEHAAANERAAAQLRATGVSPPFEQEYLRRDGTRVPVVLGSARLPAGDDADAVTFVLDVSDRKALEALTAFLMRASDVLGASLDIARTLEAVAALVVPARADWCAVYLARDDGALELAAAAHVDPARVALLRAMDRRHPFHVDDRRGPGRVVRTGRAEVVPEVTDALRRAVARDDAHFEALRELGATSAVVTPLAVHGRTLGALALAMSGGARGLTPADLAWADELARRVAIAVDNARLFEATQRERRRAEEANRSKDEFLSVASHELRTPLNAILGWARMLRTGALPEEKRERALETIERNARVQVQLVEDILDVSRIITGKLRLALAPIDPAQVVEAALDVVRPAAEAKGVRLQALLDPDAGVVHGDASRLQQVVWNLLANAVKFTPRGGRVYVRAQREESYVELVVADTGAGIEPAFLPHVFQPFRQQDASITRTHGGLGLGLAIVKHLVELHGGAITAHSEGLGKGATFTVRLPVAPVRSTSVPPVPVVSARARAAAAPLACPPELTGLDVLVVDDEPDARELIQSILEQCGAKVRVAASASEALAMFRARPPDVLVSDIGMPDASGYELIRRVRSLPDAQGGRVPAVALTAYAAMKDRTRALMEGFTAHASKPTEPQELVAVIAALVRRR